MMHFRGNLIFRSSFTFQNIWKGETQKARYIFDSVGGRIGLCWYICNFWFVFGFFLCLVWMNWDQRDKSKARVHCHCIFWTSNILIFGILGRYTTKFKNTFIKRKSGLCTDTHTHLIIGDNYVLLVIAWLVFKKLKHCKLRQTNHRTIYFNLGSCYIKVVVSIKTTTT